MSNYNMKDWLEQVRLSPVKKAFPILSFPAVQLLGISVKELISDSDKQAQGMKLVADSTDSLAAVSLMDLSVEAQCFGAEIKVSESEVPTVIGRLVETEEDAEALSVPEVGAARSGLYVEAIEKACALITDRPVFAGIIGPFSLAARLDDVTEIMMDCYDEPEKVHVLLEKATEFLIRYCKAFKSVGANGVIMAEPVAGLLSPSLAEEFSAPYVKKIFDSVKDDSFAVVYHNCGNNTIKMISSILSTEADAYHFGNSIDMAEMMQFIPDGVLAMGNVDPAAQFKNGTPESIRKETLEIMEKCCKYDNFVISSGCDIPPMSKWENINAFFDAVGEFYGK